MSSDLHDLADYLLAQRERLLTEWRGDVDDDPQLTTPSRLTRREFNDHIPAVLDALAATLRRADARHAEPVPTEADSAHGLHRWQQGYYLAEVLREWSHLLSVLVSAIERYAREHPQADPESLTAARRTLARFFREAMTDSVTQYFQLKQLEAQGRLRDLQAVVDRFLLVERDRGQLLREASHDLRGSVNVAASATAALRHPALAAEDRESMLGSLERSLTDLKSLLTDLMDLARLEAGQDPRRISSFDAAKLLTGMGHALQGAAQARGMELWFEGPAPLAVEGDPAKVQRIAQNLILNALSYAGQGAVRLQWGAEAPQRWWIEIEDQGPGLQPAGAQPLIAGLEAATQVADGSPHPDPHTAEATHLPARGEGIGLSIVKRLCEALDAGLEVRSEPGQGCVFRVSLPSRYEAPFAP